MTVLQILGVGVGLATALTLCRVSLDIESLEEIIVWMLRIGVAVAALVLSIRMSGLLSWTGRGGSMVKSELSPSLDAFVGPDGRL